MSISKRESNILKAISIISVILAHAYGWANAYEGSPILSSYRLMGLFCQGGLTLFFFLSGYGVYQSFLAKGLKDYWNNKIDKIYLPAALVQLVWFIVAYYLNIYENGNFDTGSIAFLNILCVNPKNSLDGTMWFLSFLLCCYLSFYLVLRLIKDKRVAFLSMAIYWGVLSYYIGNIWELAVYYAPFFFIGTIVSAIFSTKHYHFSFRAAFIITLLTGGLLVFYILFFFKKFIFFDTVAGLMVALLIYLLVRFVGEEKLVLLEWLGGYSFYIYLLEYKVIFAWIDYSKYTVLQRNMVIFFLFAVTLLLSFIIKKVVNRLLLG